MKEMEWKCTFRENKKKLSFQSFRKTLSVPFLMGEHQYYTIVELNSIK